MARYTDIDKLIAEYDRVHVGPAGGARKLMVEAPIADVAPRAEVAREIFEEIDKAFDECIYINPFTHIGSLKTNKLVQILIELKKKYTEGEK